MDSSINVLSEKAIEGSKNANESKERATLVEKKGKEAITEAVTGIQNTIVKVQSAFNNLSANSNDILKFVNDNVDQQFKSFGQIGTKYYEDSDFVSQMSDKVASMSKELALTIIQVSEVTQNMALTTQEFSKHTNTIRLGV